MDLSLLFTGTAGSAPTARRGLASALIRRGGERILVDCGEGTQRQLIRSSGLVELDTVLLTHHHLDHWLGLPGLLKSFALRDRERPLAVYGPPGTEDLLATARFIYGRLPYPLRVHDLEPDEPIGLEDAEIVPFNVRHRGVAFGYALVEDDRPGRFDAEKARSLGVEFGPDFGRLQRGETVNGVAPDDVIGPDRLGRRLVISGDTAPCDSLRAAADGADLLVHEATFADEELDRAQQTLHSTARQAAEIAAETGARLLALTHLSSRYGGRELLAEAHAVFEDTVLPRDFDRIEIPQPEKGPPELIRPERRLPSEPAC